MSWSEEDQDKAIAFTLAKQEICPHCGTREEDWIDPETKRPYDVPKLTPYAHRCFGCLEREKFKKSVPTDSPGVHIVFRDAEEVAAEEIAAREALKNASMY